MIGIHPGHWAIVLATLGAALRPILAEDDGYKPLAKDKTVLYRVVTKYQPEKSTTGKKLDVIATTVKLKNTGDKARAIVVCVAGESEATKPSMGPKKLTIGFKDNKLECHEEEREKKLLDRRLGNMGCQKVALAKKGDAGDEKEVTFYSGGTSSDSNSVVKVARPHKPLSDGKNPLGWLSKTMVGFILLLDDTITLSQCSECYAMERMFVFPPANAEKYVVDEEVLTYAALDAKPQGHAAARINLHSPGTLTADQPLIAYYDIEPVNVPDSPPEERWNWFVDSADPQEFELFTIEPWKTPTATLHVDFPSIVRRDLVAGFVVSVRQPRPDGVPRPDDAVLFEDWIAMRPPPDQLHVAAYPGNRVPAGGQVTLDASVQSGFVGAPGRAVEFRVLAGDVSFPVDDDAPDDRVITYFTHFDGRLNVEATAGLPGVALIQAKELGTGLTAFVVLDVVSPAAVEP